MDCCVCMVLALITAGFQYCIFNANDDWNFQATTDFFVKHCMCDSELKLPTLSVANHKSKLPNLFDMYVLGCLWRYSAEVLLHGSRYVAASAVGQDVLI